MEHMTVVGKPACLPFSKFYMSPPSIDFCSDGHIIANLKLRFLGKSSGGESGLTYEVSWKSEGILIQQDVFFLDLDIATFVDYRPDNSETTLIGDFGMVRFDFQSDHFKSSDFLFSLYWRFDYPFPMSREQNLKEFPHQYFVKNLRLPVEGFQTIRNSLGSDRAK